MALLILALFVVSASLNKAPSTCKATYESYHVSSPGDIMIGGLFPVHVKTTNALDSKKPEGQTCKEFDVRGLIKILAMVHSIEMINNSTLLPGIKLGYQIYDTCTSPTMALRAVLKFLSKANSSDNCVEVHCNYTDYLPAVKAVIGAATSEVSISVARLLNINLMPQISYSASAKILSDKIRFPAFLRTIPSDSFQSKAIANLVHTFDWNWVGTIASDDDYSRSGIDDFISEAERLGICIAFREVIPFYSSDRVTTSRIKEVANTIINKTRANVIVMFARASHVIELFEILGVHNLSKVWIASDSWSSNNNITRLETIHNIGDIVGFAFQKGNISKFENYMKNLSLSLTHPNSFLKNYYMFYNSCKGDQSKDIDTCIADERFQNYDAVTNDMQLQSQQNDFLLKNIEPGITSSIQWSVVAVAHALHTLLQCNEEICQRSLDFAPWENVKSICSSPCHPGQLKLSSESQHTCCYNCKNCSDNTYSNTTDAQECFQCQEDEWAPSGSASCNKKSIVFLEWRNAFSIVLLVFSALGIVLIFVIAVIFIKNIGTPAVRSNGGHLSFIMLFSLMLSFASVCFYLGRPNNVTCKIRQCLFGISFTLSVSCALTKSLAILIAFNFNPANQNYLKTLYNPWLIVSFCTGLQVIICAMWLIFNGPLVHWDVNRHPTEILLECNEGSYVAFAVMLGYIAFLALICFIFAFKGRKLPENYNEAKFITFSMLIYFISWITFVPVYVTTKGQFLPAVEVVTILSSTYGILCCQFFPKCYIILFKKENNTRSSFLKNLYDYSVKTAKNISNDKISSKSSPTFHPPLFLKNNSSQNLIINSKISSISFKDNNGRNWIPRKRFSSI
ncbi:G-protein coupled receptor family C group 6 member A isoform X2 [Mobula hypostoma]|uniref:G-protein coupled receptor family C group 6 member A isoform X2 n=1 Tax=Mobula hypostoma TaxID=723540 RepID=UPI002FC33A6B